MRIQSTSKVAGQAQNRLLSEYPLRERKLQSTLYGPPLSFLLFKGTQLGLAVWWTMSKPGMDSFSDSILGRDPVTRRNRALIGKPRNLQQTERRFMLDQLKEIFLRLVECCRQSRALSAVTSSRQQPEHRNLVVLPIPQRVSILASNRC